MSNVFVTNELSFAAYLTMNGIDLLRYKKLGKMHQFSFLNNQNIERLQYKYVTSESARFDDHVRKIKKLIFGDNNKDNPCHQSLP